MENLLVFSFKNFLNLFEFCFICLFFKKNYINWFCFFFKRGKKISFKKDKHNKTSLVLFFSFSKGKKIILV